MYIPKYHAMPDRAALHMHIEQHPLGSWVCTADDRLVANHIPFVLDREQGAHGRLLGHVSRANPVWRALAQGVPSVVMFMGPNAYITPAWYPGKQTHGQVVPTWNYVTVHAHGMARAIEEPAWILNMLERLTQAQESARSNPWQVSDAPAHYIEKMLRAIVGIELTIDHLEGRNKISQDEDRDDRLGTVEGLMQTFDAPAQVLAGMVLRELKIEEHDREGH
ncbi:FMN-binding negative transcriptional regulator [Macromonas nakdongensis]|uniref:FMN-binding negative transcriptional regulator n=1 Tax=Macromonas nakdongensis TaxID=1843082 RepID=UPI000C33B250|nr:FMN-binding negative transcriptional regulator [Macromonas nakdongensis]